MTLTPSKLVIVGLSYFSNVTNTTIGREGSSYFLNIISCITLNELFTNPSPILMFAVNMIYAPFTNSSCDLRPFTTFELAFLASPPPLYIAAILATRCYNDLSMLILILSTSSHFVRIDIISKNFSCLV